MPTLKVAAASSPSPRRWDVLEEPVDQCRRDRPGREHLDHRHLDSRDADCAHGYVKLVRGRHSRDFLDELSSFPHGKHDDCVDALSGAHNSTNTHNHPARLAIPRGRIDLPVPGLSYAYQHYPNDPYLERIAHRIGATVWTPPPPGIERR